MPMLRNQITETLQQAEKQERKEIEGLGKRLMDLDELLRKMKRNVEHQSDMAQSFLQVSVKLFKLWACTNLVLFRTKTAWRTLKTRRFCLTYVQLTCNNWI